MTNNTCHLLRFEFYDLGLMPGDEQHSAFFYFITDHDFYRQHKSTAVHVLMLIYFFTIAWMGCAAFFESGYGRAFKIIFWYQDHWRSLNVVCGFVYSDELPSRIRAEMNLTQKADFV